RHTSCCRDWSSDVCSSDLRVDIEAAKRRLIPLKLGSMNYSSFRGMLFRARVFFDGRPVVGFLWDAKGRLTIGDHPRLAALRALRSEARRVGKQCGPVGTLA